MKTEKAKEEAILRAYQTTEEANQTQEELLHMKEQAKLSSDKSQLNESPTNVMRSWQHLRNLDQDLAEKKYSDLPEDAQKPKKEKE
ncbi:hypothetical protein ACSX1A_13755 [Pontibacter sp. MBLB2868]|uniref:hypothetical protein n=1 Tax=Pontibacter sp. MBLB2868 TaxID=3451555 RepID=UPI003F74B78F